MMENTSCQFVVPLEHPQVSPTQAALHRATAWHVEGFEDEGWRPVMGASIM